jgi:hypothetical protein
MCHRPLCWIFLSAALLCAQKPPATLEGDVVHAVTGAPMPAVRIKLVAGQSEPLYGSADSGGHFRLVNLPSGYYSLDVERPGLSPWHFDKVDLRAHENDFPLVRMFEGVNPPLLLRQAAK